MRIKKGFVLREVCGDPVIMAQGVSSIDFGKLLGLSESAAWLWQEAQRQGDFTVESLAAALYDEYEISRQQARHDVEKLVEQLKEQGVVE